MTLETKKHKLELNYTGYNLKITERMTYIPTLLYTASRLTWNYRDFFEILMGKLEYLVFSTLINYLYIFKGYIA